MSRAVVTITEFRYGNYCINTAPTFVMRIYSESAVSTVQSCWFKIKNQVRAVLYSASEGMESEKKEKKSVCTCVFIYGCMCECMYVLSFLQYIVLSLFGKAALPTRLLEWLISRHRSIRVVPGEFPEAVGNGLVQVDVVGL